jgi:hypothetical protein
MMGNALPSTMSVPNEICSTITMGGTPAFSKLPLGQCILGYTFAYLMFGIINNNYVLNNLPTIIFFPVVIIADMVWNLKNSCYSITRLIGSLIIGGGVGFSWGLILHKSKLGNLQYFTKVSGKEECSRPAKSTFKCNVYKNGKLLSQNIG